MPYKALTDTDRRALTLEALSGEKVAGLAEKYSVTPSHVYRLMEEARKRAEEEAAYWNEVYRLVYRRRADDTDSLETYDPFKH